MTTKLIDIETIAIDPRCQQRELDRDNIARLVEVLADGGAFIDPVDVFADGDTFCLAHGFHRYYASMQHGCTQIDATIHVDGVDAAIDYSCQPLNAKHGQPETRADRERRVKRMIERHGDWSDRRIADHCGVHSSTVGTYRNQVSNLDTCEKRVGKDGKSYPATKPRKSTTETTTEILDKDTGEVIENPLVIKTSEPATAPKVKSHPLAVSIQIDASDAKWSARNLRAKLGVAFGCELAHTLLETTS